MRKTEKGMSPFWDYLGMEEKQIGDGKAVLELPLKGELLQRRGSAHGGVLATLIDAAVGSAIRSTLSEEQAAATVDLDVSYLKPGKGTHLIAKGSLIHKSRTMAFGTAEIYDETGQMVVYGKATYKLLGT